MEALGVVLADDLPVGADLVLDALRSTQAADGVVLDSGRKVVQIGEQRLGGRVEVHEEEAGPRLEPNGDEALVLEREVVDVLGVRSAPQRSVEVVDPGVVRALDAHDLAARRAIGGLVEKRRPTMAADVVERIDRAGAVAHDGNALPGDADQQVRAGFGDVLFAAHAHPRPSEPALLLEREDARVVKDARRQEMSLVNGLAHGRNLGRR